MRAARRGAAREPYLAYRAAVAKSKAAPASPSPRPSASSASTSVTTTRCRRATVSISSARRAATSWLSVLSELTGPPARRAGLIRRRVETRSGRALRHAGDFSSRLCQQRAVRLVGAVELSANLIEQLAVDFLCIGRSARYGVECLLNPFGDIAARAQLRIVE